jgi:hypothetical protein
MSCNIHRSPRAGIERYGRFFLREVFAFEAAPRRIQNAAEHFLISQ